MPLLVLSPYAKHGYIDDAFSEFSSPLRFVADNWDLPYLTPRIARAHNFEHVFDFDRSPRPPAPRPNVPATNKFWDFPDDFPGWPPQIQPQDPQIRFP